MAYTLLMTDGDWISRFTNDEAGWILLNDGWAPRSAAFKGGGYYSNALMSHGQQLRHAKFDNVVEALLLKLAFTASEPDQFINQVDMLEELGMVRAPQYWIDPRNHSPVWLERQLDGETGTAYCLVNQAKLSYPAETWSACAHSRGRMDPFLLTIDRQPFWLGAQPGTTQADVELSAEQVWDYNLLWAVEDASPAGYIFCFVETRTGDIYAGGESEIWKWNGSSWASETTTPVTLTGNVTSAVILNNGDILFGEDGRVIKNSGGTYSVESTDPSGQVESLVLAPSGEVYAGENGTIWIRSTAGSWSSDSTLPAGYVYSLINTSTGKVLAGADGEILRQTDPPVTASFTALLSNDEEDNGEQYNATVSVPPAGQDLDLFNYNYVAVRFALDVPASAQINSCKLRVMQRGSSVSGTSLAAKIYCEDADDSSALVASDNNISSRSLTTAYVPWQDSAKRARNQWFRSPDFSNALQEVIDRGGWATGQHVLVVVKCDNTTYSSDHASRRQVWDYTGCRDQAPALEISYTSGSADSWEVVYTDTAEDFRSLLETDEDLILAGATGEVLGSDDNGSTWGTLSTTPTNDVRALYQDSNGDVWAGDDGNILKSADGGRSFVADSTTPTNYCAAFIEETDTGDMRAGDDGNILILDASDSVTLGRADSTLDEVFVANKHNQANLTHVKVDDGGAFTDIFPISSYPEELLPSTFAVDDACYFGIDTSLDDTGPFCSLIFNIATPASATTSYTIVWEYYNGSWTTLTCLDETEQFSQPGVRAVVWKQPSDWATVAIDSDTAYWVRARVSALTGTPTTPTQQTEDIYSVPWSHVEIDSDQLLGNIDSLIQLRLHNRSDGTSGGPGGSEPLLYSNRILAGAKPVSGHTNFRSFINFADEQNVTGVTVSVADDPDSATAIQADSNLSSATGRRVFFDASVADSGNGLDNWEDRVTITLGPTVARDYYGTYKAFLRCYQSGGSAGEVNLRLKVVGGSGGVSSITESQETQSTSDHELVEFNSPLVIPVSAQMTPDELGDETSIVVQISVEETDADLYLYDIFLLPVDTVWLDATDKANNAESSVENGRRLLVDSVTIPKFPTRGMAQKIEAGTNAATWVVNGDGPARLPTNQQLRIWFLAARTSTTGSSYTWHSDPEVLHSVTLAKVDRWLFGRGEA